MKVLWVTSFNEQLLNASGRKLILSFHGSKIDGDLLLACEGGTHEDADCRECITIDLDSNPILQQWLEANRDIIPDHFGGEATECDCKVDGDKLAPAARHARGCHWAWFNRICSRWFRKLPALDAGVRMGYDAVIWLDSDCYFHSPIQASNVEHLFGGLDVFYMKGPFRKVPECGIVGYKLRAKGGEFFRKFLDCYMSGEFRQLERWDDSYVFDYVRQNGAAHCSSRDIASQAHGRDGHVVQHSRIGRWIRHDKGKHGRVMRIMDDNGGES